MDWCDAMKNGQKYSKDIMLKFVLLFIKYKLPQLVHPCPYDPVTVEKNFTIESNIAALIPHGFYRFNLTWKYKEDELIVWADILLEMY